jgi:hypothetical protein
MLKAHQRPETAIHRASTQIQYPGASEKRIEKIEKSTTVYYDGFISKYLIAKGCTLSILWVHVAEDRD